MFVLATGHERTEDESRGLYAAGSRLAKIILTGEPSILEGVPPYGVPAAVVRLTFHRLPSDTRTPTTRRGYPRDPLRRSFGIWCAPGGILPLFERPRGHGLEPLERKLLNDIGPLPLGRELPASLCSSSRPY